MKRPLLGLTVAVALAFGTVPAHADSSPLVNVSFDTTLRTEDLLEGPAGGLDTTWNQFGLAGPGAIGTASSAANLLDSAGVPTAAGFTLDADSIYDWGSPNLQLLTGGAFIFGGGGGTLVIVGLDDGRKYDLYIASFYPNESGCLGTFSTPNPAGNGGSQLLDNGVDQHQGGWVGNSDTWVQGSNYVRFADVAPVDGRIVVQGVPGPQSVRNWNPNLHFNGFQLVDMSGAPPAADILTFVFPGLPEASISETSIALTVPFGTDVTALAPTYTVSAGATAVPASGSVQDFSDPVTYTVTSSDGSIAKSYTVTVMVTPASTAKDILTFGLPGLPAVIAGTEIAWAVPSGTNVASLAPEYTVSSFATGAPPSGTSRNFASPQAYTVTAQDGSSQVYTVTVAPSDVSPLINVSIDVERRDGDWLEGPAGGLGTTWNQALNRCIPGTCTEIWENDLLDSGGLVGTVAFKTDAGNLDPWYEGPPDKPLLLTAAAFNFGGETPYNTEISGLRPGFYDLYIASGYPNEDGSQGVFTTANTTSNGPDQTLDNGVRFGQGGNLFAWGQGVNYVLFHNVEPDLDSKIQFTSVGAFGARCMLSGFQLVWNPTETVFTGKDILSFVVPGNGLPDVRGTIVGTEITVHVASGTDVTALAPMYTVSPMATCDPISGDPVDFTDPVDYTVTAEDGTSKTYTVTVVTVAGGTTFHRGDANDDGMVNITDGIYVLNYLFLGGPEPTCLEAANANDDANVNITDGIYILNYLFLGGEAPPAPGPEDSPCGEDPLDSETRIGCEAYASCQG